MRHEKSILSQKISRRSAISTAGKIAITAVVAGVVAGVGGYLAGSAAAPPKTVTSTATETKTVTAGAVTVTQTQTVTQTVTKTVTAGAPATTTTAPAELWRQQPFKGVTIRVPTLASGPKGPISGALYFIRDRWEAVSGAKLEIIELPFSDLPVKIMADLTTGTGLYDGFVPCSNICGDLVVPGYVHLVEKWFGDPRFPPWDPALFPWAIAQCSQWGGKWWGVPLDDDAWYLYWNIRWMDYWMKDKDKMREFKNKYGYELNIYEWYKRKELTWQKIRDVAEFFTGWDWNNDGEPDYGIVMGLKVGEQGPMWYFPFVAPWVVEYGPMRDRTHNVFWFDPETMEPLLKTEGFIEGTKFFGELVNKCGPKAQFNWSFSEMWDFFLYKQKAMFMWSPPDAFTLVGNPERSTMRGYLGSAPGPGSEHYYSLTEKRWVEKVNNVGNCSGCSWHGWVSTLSKNPEATYHLFAYMAMPEIHRAIVGAGTGVDTGCFGDILVDYGGRATLADFNLPGGGVDPGFPTAPYNEYDFRRMNIAVMNQFFCMDAQWDYLRIPGATAMYVAADTHIIGEFLSGEISAEEALDRTYRDWEKIIDEYGREKMLKWYQEMINYGKENPYKPRPWIVYEHKPVV